ncbi:MAG: 16S rRNA (uracil(1498)-N(3))-methyltransferase [Proteobacteria bacterium]|nr:16S rRNA (uracil(1498)-N(3))-methyltransferase [Pseudomonadota bacterium]
MSLTRLFVSGDLRPDLQLDLNEDQTRYIGRVLRLRAGDSLAVFNGDKGEFSATVASIAKTSAVIKLHVRIETATESPLKVHLVQGVSRGDRMDLVVQKATELGVKRISPVLTEYGVVKLDASRALRRQDHWQKIAESACEQSGRIRPPLIDTPMPLKSWLGTKTKDADTDLILQPGAATPLTSIIKPETEVCILIGPEGGFSDKELEDAAVAGFVSVSLGPRILRTESAAIASIAIVQSLWGDLAP